MRIRILLIVVLVALLCQMRTLAQSPDKKTGLLKHQSDAFAGYTLFAPSNGQTCYLIDMEGRVVHQWNTGYTPGQSVYLLDNGHLLMCAHSPGRHEWHGGGVGGLLVEYDWDGKLVWKYGYNSEKVCQHHDIEPLPSGNVLILAWERKTTDEAVQAGRDPALVSSNGVWPDHIVEVKPTGAEGGEIVWEWHVWDHLVQDFDEHKDNYGSIVEHPELVDINYTGVDPRESKEATDRLRAIGYLSGPHDGPPHQQRADWNHTNAINYDPVRDQIVLSVLEFHEIWVIDHSTTTREAAGHTGGRWGKGGDLLYRCGNPMAHGVGTVEEQTLFAQHDAQWIDQGLPGAGNILLFNNGRGRVSQGATPYSSVDELKLPCDSNAGYRRADTFGFARAKTVWHYGDAKKNRFFSGHISGAQRLANGNTLICSGEEGRIFEVTSAGKTVWEYVNPFQSERGHRPPHMGPPDGRGGPGDSGRRGPRRGEDGEKHKRPDRGRGKMQGGPGGRGFRPPHPPRGHKGGPDEMNALFRATRISPDHPGLKGRKLKPIKAETATTQKADI